MQYLDLVNLTDNHPELADYLRENELDLNRALLQKIELEGNRRNSEDSGKREG